MKTPQTKEDVQRFIGFVTYLSKTCPKLSEETKPLREVLRKNTQFFWEEPQQEAFRKVKELVTQAPVLNLFDPVKDITLAVDACSTSLGAALLQDGGPFEYAAKARTGEQINYAQIEKELQAIVFGCERFHSYIYGREVTVETDHKPLFDVFKKHIDTASPRIQV